MSLSRVDKLLMTFDVAQTLTDAQKLEYMTQLAVLLEKQIDNLTNLVSNYDAVMAETIGDLSKLAKN